MVQVREEISHSQQDISWHKGTQSLLARSLSCFSEGKRGALANNSAQPHWQLFPKWSFLVPLLEKPLPTAREMQPGAIALPEAVHGESPETVGMAEIPEMAGTSVCAMYEVPGTSRTEMRKTAET